MHDDTLTDDNRDKFICLTEQYNQLVKFYNVAELCADKLAEIKKLFPYADKTRFSMGMFYRFFIPDVLPPSIDKAIYLDADIIVNLDINELWNVELGDKVLASVADIDCNHRTHSRDAKGKFLITNGFVADEDYFVSGVLMFNLKQFRMEDENIKRGMQFLKSHPEMKYPDQDILNYLYSKDYVKADEKFDVFVTHARVTEKQLRSAIYHYVVGCLNLNMNDPFSRLWMKYFIKTPFFDVDTIGHIHDELQRLHDDLKNFAVNATTNVSRKSRAFLIEPQKIDWLKKLFSARDDEIFLPAENTEESMIRLIDEMKRNKGKCIFFIMTAKHMGKPFPFNRLIQEGFTEGEDFIRGWSFLSGKHGVKYNSRPLVKQL